MWIIDVRTCLEQLLSPNAIATPLKAFCTLDAAMILEISIIFL